MTPTRTAYLEVNAIPLALKSWFILDLDAQMLSAQTLSGGDHPLHQGAVKSYPRYKTQTRRQFQMVILGEYDKDAAATADPRAGCTLNAEYLTANLGIGLTTGDGTVTAIWHRWDSSTKTAAVTVVGLDLGEIDKRSHLTAVLTLLVPPAGFV